MGGGTSILPVFASVRSHRHFLPINVFLKSQSHLSHNFFRADTHFHLIHTSSNSHSFPPHTHIFLKLTHIFLKFTLTSSNSHSYVPQTQTHIFLTRTSASQPYLPQTHTHFNVRSPLPLPFPSSPSPSFKKFPMNLPLPLPLFPFPFPFLPHIHPPLYLNTFHVSPHPRISLPHVLRIPI